MNVSDARRDPVEELAEEFARRLRQGERPSLSEYTTRHPELAAQIRDLFPALVMIEQCGSIAGPATLPTRSAAPARLGDFRVVREIGRGGMGVVYEAVQESLGRHVALKVLPAGEPTTSGAARERFRREAKAAARLHHTNIVPVFAVGEDGDTLYYAMQFIRGQGLDTVLAEVCRLRSADGTTPRPVPTLTSDMARRLVTGPLGSTVSPVTRGPVAAFEGLPSNSAAEGGRAVVVSSSGDLAAQPEGRYFRAIAHLGLQVAEALHYAHGQGVLHRDVKPSNLLLDAGGNVWVTDFGLAKAADSDNLTGTGDLIGTLRYMAPERFRGRADERADVYSLGVSLYELLALRPAFDDTDRLRLIDQIGRTDPPPLRTLAPEAPRDLETVVHKALSRAPSDRYATAQEFADDLRRFLDGRPIKARRHRLLEQIWRWCRRNPAVATLAGAVALLLVTVAVGATVSAVRLKAALGDATANLSRAVTAEVDADTNRWRSHLLDARAKRLSRGPGQRFAALASLRHAAEITRRRGMPPAEVAEMRTEAIAALVLPDLHVGRWWDGWSAGTVNLSFAADLETYARSSADGTVSVRKVTGDRELCLLPTLGGVCDARISPNGRSLFQFESEPPHRGRLWDLTANPPVGRADATEVDTYADFRADGRWLAVPHRDGAITVIESASGRALYRLAPEPAVNVARPILHPTLPLIAVSSYQDHNVVIRDLRTGEVVTRLTLPWLGGGFAGWNPSGRGLYVCQGDGGEVRLYDFDPAADPPVVTDHTSFRAETGGGTWAVFDPAGDRLAVSGWSGAVSLFEATTGRLLIETPPAGRAGEIRFDATGRRLSAARQIGGSATGLWAVGDGRACRVVSPGRIPRLRPPAVSPDGTMGAVQFDSGLTLIDLASGRELATVPNGRPGATDRAVSFAFDGTGALLVNGPAGCIRRPVRLTTDGIVFEPQENLPFHIGDSPIAASRDGRVLAQAMFNGYGMQAYVGGWILHPDRPDEPRRVAAGQNVGDAAVSPDGRWVAFGVFNENVRVFEAATGRPAWQSPGGGHRCLFTPDSRWLLTETDGGRPYSTDTWTAGPRLGPGRLDACSADGRTAVLALMEGAFRLVEIETGRELARLEDPDHYAGLSALTPDGTRLVALARDGIRIWDLRAIRGGLADLGLDWDAPPFPPATAAVGGKPAFPTAGSPHRPRRSQ
jgi:serine/threonine protein kinase/WD40 repeat protein